MVRVSTFINSDLCHQRALSDVTHDHRSSFFLQLWWRGLHITATATATVLFCSFLWLWMMEVTRIRQEDCRIVALSTTAFFFLICLKARHPDMPSRIQRTATTFSCEAINTQSVYNNDCCAVGHQLLGKVLPLFSCKALLDSVNLHS